MKPPQIYPMLAIDAGNTCVKFARVARKNSPPRIFAAVETRRLAASRVRELWRASGCRTAAAACVVKAATRALRGGCPGMHFIGEKSPLNFPTRVDRSTVGADRLANMAEAARQFGRDVLVADFGTAATFDFLDADGNFAGGAIAPGLGVMARTLAAAADQLPGAALLPPVRFVGRNTREALRAGVAGGYSGMTRHLIARIAGKKTRLIFTGGDARAVARLTQCAAAVDPRWTLKGIAVLGDLAARSK